MAGFHERALVAQAAALRTAVLRAGPSTPVPTCPDWDVRELLRHTAQIYALGNIIVQRSPDAPTPDVPEAPEVFDDVLAWWDEQLTELAGRLSTMDDSIEVWTIFDDHTVYGCARRMAHESAIHRLDAEYAAAGLPADQVHELLFDPRLAADGIDEMLTQVLPTTRDWSRQRDEGDVLYHAADSGRTWLVAYRPGHPPRVGVPTSAVLDKSDVDATVAGTSDALYRQVWGRPGHALVRGDAELAHLVHGV